MPLAGRVGTSLPEFSSANGHQRQGIGAEVLTMPAMMSPRPDPESAGASNPSASGQVPLMLIIYACYGGAHTAVRRLFNLGKPVKASSAFLEEILISNILTSGGWRSGRYFQSVLTSSAIKCVSLAEEAASCLFSAVSPDTCWRVESPSNCRFVNSPQGQLADAGGWLSSRRLGLVSWDDFWLLQVLGEPIRSWPILSLRQRPLWRRRQLPSSFFCLARIRPSMWNLTLCRRRWGHDQNGSRCCGWQTSFAC